MKQHFIAILSLVLALLYGCSSGRYVSLDELQKGPLQEGAVCVISKQWDLKGKTVYLPKNSTLIFKEGGCLKNGTLVGSNTKIKYKAPFIGESVAITNCVLSGQKVVRDSEVFLSVKHTQSEIQTLFDIGDGKRLVFSKGTYQNIEKIEINSNVDADFNGSTINLKYDKEHVGECFYMKPWVNKHIDYVKIKNLTIKGKRDGIKGTVARRCIQLFYVSEVELENITIDKFYAGPQEFKDDSSDLLDKTRIGTSSISIIHYDKCMINNCRTNDISNEIFWCVPNTNPCNITYFTNNKSTCSSKDGSSSFFTILDGRCIVKSNEVHNYNGSAFNAFCYDSEISYNKFYDGKRSVAIDLSEGTMYRAKNVDIHDNYCYNTKGMVAAFGEGILICNNRWQNDVIQDGTRIYVINIATRGKRGEGGRYVGCENNQELVSGSRDIVIEGNECKNTGTVNGEDVRFALLYGNDIKLSDNEIAGCNVPVVQLVDGNVFEYANNVVRDTPQGNYAELLINRGKNVFISNNVFSRVHIVGKSKCNVQLLSVEGELTYIGNSLRLNDYSTINNVDYTPCYIADSTKLENVRIIVK